MDDEEISPADEKALALAEAYVALVRALCLGGALEHDALMAQLAGANRRLQQLGETGAAAHLGALAESLLAAGD